MFYELVPWHRGRRPGAPIGTGPAAEYKPTLPDVTWESRRCIEGVWGTPPAAGGTLKLMVFRGPPQACVRCPFLGDNFVLKVCQKHQISAISASSRLAGPGLNRSLLTLLC